MPKKKNDDGKRLSAKVFPADSDAEQPIHPTVGESESKMEGTFGELSKTDQGRGGKLQGFLVNVKKGWERLSGKERRP